MSYPPMRYTGEGGETSAWIRSHDAPPDVHHASGGSVDYLALGAASNGEFGLYACTTGRPGRTRLRATTPTGSETS